MSEMTSWEQIVAEGWGPATAAAMVLMNMKTYNDDNTNTSALGTAKTYFAELSTRAKQGHPESAWKQALNQLSGLFADDELALLDPGCVEELDEVTEEQASEETTTEETTTEETTIEEHKEEIQGGVGGEIVEEAAPEEQSEEQVDEAPQDEKAPE